MLLLRAMKGSWRNYKPQTIGGGPASGLGKDFVDFLDSGLKGHFGAPGQAFDGANPVGSTTGIAGILNEILSGGAGQFGGHLQDMISRQSDRDIGDLRARFGMSGTGLGTPGASAESIYRADSQAKTPLAIGEFQLKALEPILQSIYGISQKGIPQAETILKPSNWLSGISAISSLLPGAADIKKAWAPAGVGGDKGSGSKGDDASFSFNSGSADLAALLQNPDILKALGGMA